MKTLMMLLVITAFVSIEVSAQEQAPGFGSGQPPIRWIDYLSEIEKKEIARKAVEREIKRLESTGGPDKDLPARQISFPVTLIPLDSSSTDGNSAATATNSASSDTSGGNVSCNINTQSPHAGSGPGGTWVVKAKSSGTCDYEHIVGQLPPPITWDLQMALMDYASNPNPLGIPEMTTATHRRIGLNVAWSASSAQVFSSTCVNGSYFHVDVVWVVPPSGWTYVGPQPITIPNGKSAIVGGC